MDKANKINETLTELTNRYPINRLEEIGLKTRGGVASANYRHIMFNKKYMGKTLDDEALNFAENQATRRATIQSIINRYPNGRIPSAMRSRIESLERELQYTRWGVLDSYDDKIRGLVIHEYGHIIADQYFAQLNRSGRNFGRNPFSLQTSWGIIHDNAVKNGDIYTISQYGGSNSHEFFAECFAAREMGETLPDYIEEFIRRLLENGALPIL